MRNRLAQLCVGWLALVVGFAGFIQQSAFAEDPSASWDPVEDYAFADRSFVLPYPRIAPQGRVVINIDHRAFEPLDNDPFSSLLGFDNGALTIGLGVRYSLLDFLDVGMRRFNSTVNEFDAYELNSKFLAMNEKFDPADLALGAGASWFDAETGNDEFGQMAEILAGKTLLPKFYATTGLMYHSQSERTTGDPAADNYSIALLASANLLVINRLALVTEWSIPVAGFERDAAAWAVGPKYFLHGHTFSLLVSNAHELSDDRMASGSDRWNNPIFGFTITRQL